MGTGNRVGFVHEAGFVGLSNEPVFDPDSSMCCCRDMALEMMRRSVRTIYLGDVVAIGDIRLSRENELHAVSDKMVRDLEGHLGRDVCASIRALARSGALTRCSRMTRMSWSPAPGRYGRSGAASPWRRSCGSMAEVPGG